MSHDSKPSNIPLLALAGIGQNRSRRCIGRTRRNSNVEFSPSIVFPRFITGFYNLTSFECICVNFWTSNTKTIKMEGCGMNCIKYLLVVFNGIFLVSVLFLIKCNCNFYTMEFQVCPKFCFVESSISVCLWLSRALRLFILVRLG